MTTLENITAGCGALIVAFAMILLGGSFLRDGIREWRKNNQASPKTYRMDLVVHKDGSCYISPDPEIRAESFDVFSAEDPRRIVWHLTLTPKPEDRP